MNAVPVVCRLFRGGKNRLRALAKTYRGYPPRSSFVTLRGPRGHYPACGFKKQFKCSAGGLPPLPKNNSNAVPVVCRLFRGGKNRLRALANTYRGSSLHFAAAPFFPPRSLAFAQAQATATAETPHGDEMKRTAARGCSCSLVPVVGLEPTRCLHLRILSPVRLPFRHTGINFKAASCDTAFFGGTIRI